MALGGGSQAQQRGGSRSNLAFAEIFVSLVDTTTRVFRERAEIKQREFMGAAQAHVVKGAAMLFDAIEQKFEDVIDRVP